MCSSRVFFKMEFLTPQYKLTYLTHFGKIGNKCSPGREPDYSGNSMGYSKISLPEELKHHSSITTAPKTYSIFIQNPVK